MPFVPAPNIVQAEIRMTLDGQRIENRIMVDTLEPVTAGLPLAVADEIHAWSIDSYSEHLSTAVTFREIYAKGLDAPDGFEATAPFSGLTGQLLGNPLPNHVTICASLRTGHIGRSARGRFYWACLLEEDVNQNKVNEGTLANYRTILQGLRTRITNAGWQWAVVSYRHNNAPRPGGPVYYLISDVLFTDNTVDSQRRRLPGRGR